MKFIQIENNKKCQIQNHINILSLSSPPTVDRKIEVNKKQINNDFFLSFI